MKYPTLKSEKKKALQIGPLNKGVDLSNAPLYINGGCISDCKNLIFSDGVLKTRAGITADNQNILKSDYTDDAFFNSYRISDSEFFIGGEYFRIVTETSELDITEYCTSIYLLNRDRQLTPVGCIKFTDSETTYSYMPSRFTFFQGKPQSGCGLFAFVTKIDTETYSQSLYEIYELNPDMTKWKN